MLSSLRSFTASDIAQKRMEMIAFYDQFGEDATKQAFSADRKVISRWKKRLADSGGKFRIYETASLCLLLDIPKKSLHYIVRTSAYGSQS